MWVGSGRAKVVSGCKTFFEPKGMPSHTHYLYIYIYLSIYLFLSYLGPRSRVTHGRDFWRPLGNCGYGFVAVGNLLGCRCILLIYVAVSRGLKFILEQPDGSSLPLHPRWEELLGHVQALWMEGKTNILGMRCSGMFAYGSWVWQIIVITGSFKGNIRIYHLYKYLNLNHVTHIQIWIDRYR